MSLSFAKPLLCKDEHLSSRVAHWGLIRCDKARLRFRSRSGPDVSKGRDRPSEKVSSTRIAQALSTLDPGRGEHSHVNLKANGLQLAGSFASKCSCASCRTTAALNNFKLQAQTHWSALAPGAPCEPQLRGFAAQAHQEQSAHSDNDKDAAQAAAEEVSASADADADAASSQAADNESELYDDLSPEETRAKLLEQDASLKAQQAEASALSMPFIPQVITSASAYYVSRATSMVRSCAGIAVHVMMFTAVHLVMWSRAVRLACLLDSCGAA